MTRAFGIRLALTLLVLGCAVSAALRFTPAIPQAHFWVRLVHVRGDLYRVQQRTGFVLPKGLEVGDRIPIGQLTASSRAVLLKRAAVLPGTTLRIPIERAGHRLEVTLRAQAATRPPAMSSGYAILLSLELVIFLAVMLAIVLLTLWRGRNWSAWAFSAVFILQLLDKGLFELPASPGWFIWMQQGHALSTILQLAALCIIADALGGGGLPGRQRRVARIGFATLIGLMVICYEIANSALILDGLRVFPTALVGVMDVALGALSLAAFGLILLVLIGGYRLAPHQERLRIRWVFWITALLGITVSASVFLLNSASFEQNPYLFQLVDLTLMLCLVGYLYAILRTRLIDVGFVVDRALVFGFLTALVFGSFSLLEEGLHQFAVSDKVGWILQALVALVLAMVLSPLHRRLERWIERLFFRSQQLVLLAIERLARECPFVERESDLLERVIERLKPECAGVAVYERAGNRYRRLAASADGWPEAVDVDDAAFIALRESHEPVALAAQANQVGSEGLALPMTVAESLHGALVCRPRDGEQFSHEMRGVLANLAHQLGMALTGLRHQEHARLVADVAAGRIDPETARRRALTLVAGGRLQADPGPA